MKEILIYGALVAAMISASVPLIQNLQTTVSTKGNQVNTAIQTELDRVIGAVDQSAGDSSGVSGE
jgi:mannose/fructose/N-acetylgalactosamine-specific phosphotransferase system component IID